MKRILSFLVPAAFVAILVVVAIKALAGDESRIRSQIEAFTVAFNDQNLGNCLDVIDPGYRDESVTEVDRKMLTTVLRYVFMKQMRSDGKAVAMRIRVPEQSLHIEIDEGEKAHVDFEGILENRKGEEWRLQWHVQVESTMRKVDGDWLIYRTRHSTLEGKRPQGF